MTRLGLFLLFVSACHTGTVSISADVACEDLAKAECAKRDQCIVGGVADAFGDLATCQTRMHDACVASLAAPSTGASADTVSSCASAYPAITCTQWLDDDVQASCPQPKGSLTDGTACTFNGQCTSGFCGKPQGAGCGTCAELPQVGDACDQTDAATSCGPDMVCTSANTCAKIVATGATCDDVASVCGRGGSCVAGTCQVAGATAGVACDPKHETAPGCDPTQALFCSSAKVCTRMTDVTDGMSCGDMTQNTVYDRCTAASSCWGSTCAALGKEGDACDLTNGPGCMLPARCVDGTCQAADATMCPAS